MEAYQIIHQILVHFRGLPEKLQRITEKSDEWFSSHGREPKTRNPLQSGNVSPLTHYLKFVRLYEAADKGAGKMLNRRVYAELESEFTENIVNTSQKELQKQFLKEAFEFLKCLAEKEFEHASSGELAEIEQECMEVREVASDAIAHLRAIKRTRESERLKV
jgi:hypothetical protein